MRALVSIIMMIYSYQAVAEYTTTVIGRGGTQTCLSYTSPSDSQDYASNIAWVGGYWSGLNAMNDLDHTVGDDMDVSLIFKELNMYCSKNPSEVLYKAVSNVYYQISSQRLQNRSRVTR